MPFTWKLSMFMLRILYSSIAVHKKLHSYQLCRRLHYLYENLHKVPDDFHHGSRNNFLHKHLRMDSFCWFYRNAVNDNIAYISSSVPIWFEVNSIFFKNFNFYIVRVCIRYLSRHFTTNTKSITFRVKNTVTDYNITWRTSYISSIGISTCRIWWR